MSIQHNFEGLNQLILPEMAELYLSQSKNKEFLEMTFDERLAILIDAQISAKHNRRIENIKRRAKFRINNASIEDIKYYPDRMLDKNRILTLSLCDYIEENQNIIITGATGSGKTYLSCAFGLKACDRCIPTRYVRLPDLLLDLDEARQNNTYKKRLTGWAKTKLLIIDEWMLTEITKMQRNDILELLELRYETTSTIFASQYAPQGWIDRMGKSAITDSIMDRIVSNAFLIEIQGDASMRMRKDK